MQEFSHALSLFCGMWELLFLDGSTYPSYTCHSVTHQSRTRQSFSGMHGTTYFLEMCIFSSGCLQDYMRNHLLSQCSVPWRVSAVAFQWKIMDCNGKGGWVGVGTMGVWSARLSRNKARIEKREKCLTAKTQERPIIIVRMWKLFYWHGWIIVANK